MKSFLVLTMLLGSQIIHAGTTEDQIRSLARRVNVNSQAAERLTADEKIVVLKALNNADSILSRVADHRDPVPPTRDPREPRDPRPAPRVSCDSEMPSIFHPTFIKIKNFAYSSSGLNYSTSKAISFAEEWTRNNPCEVADQYIQTVIRLIDFSYSSKYLNSSKSDAITFAVENAGRFCAGANIESDFTEHYKFAYSSSGLNLSSSAAKSYAKDKVSGAFSCGN